MQHRARRLICVQLVLKLFIGFGIVIYASGSAAITFKSNDESRGIRQAIRSQQHEVRIGRGVEGVENPLPV